MTARSGVLPSSITRRSVFAIGAASFAAPSALGQNSGLAEEFQHGDPDTPFERVRVDPALVRDLASGVNRATFNPRNPAFGAVLLSVAGRFVGRDRVKDEDDITAFLDMFDLPFRDEKGDYIPYCASGVAYAAALSYQEFWSPSAASPTTTTLRESLPEMDRYHFYPSPSVRDMYYVALGKRRWKDGSPIKLPDPKPGWVIIYSFNRDADHCGILESVDGATLNTIEFNTSNGLSGDQRNGGMVARRQRSYNAQIKGFIVTDAA